jgi:hypothetical protein
MGWGLRGQVRKVREDILGAEVASRRTAWDVLGVVSLTIGKVVDSKR